MNPVIRASVGGLLREWRQRRRLSQLDLAADAEVSTRHLSFVETGRSLPSREMLLRLAERLDVPLRERNRLFTAAGYAPMYAERGLDDPALAEARRAVEQVLKSHEPCPALAADRHWNLVACNRAVPLLLDGVAPALLKPPVNVLRLALDPRGIAPRIVNFAQWRGHLLHRLAQQVAASADPHLAALEAELLTWPAPADDRAHDASESHVIVPLVIDCAAGRLSFISTVTVFGTPVDVTLSELAVETFFPADDETRAVLQRWLT